MDSFDTFTLKREYSTLDGATTLSIVAPSGAYPYPILLVAKRSGCADIKAKLQAVTFETKKHVTSVRMNKLFPKGKPCSFDMTDSEANALRSKIREILVIDLGFDYCGSTPKYLSGGITYSICYILGNTEVLLTLTSQGAATALYYYKDTKSWLPDPPKDAMYPFGPDIEEKARLFLWDYLQYAKGN